MEDIFPLVHNAQTGNPEAFAVLVSRFQNLAYAYAYAILSDFDLAQDAVQEALVEVYLSLPALQEPYAFPSWLKRIVFKYCDRIIRRKQLHTIPLEYVEDMAFSQPGPLELIELSETSSQVKKALQAISADLRVVTILFYISGYSQQEIADFLGVPVKTVKSRLHTSRQRLKERLFDMVQDEFERHQLPEQFTRETVEQALLRAVELNKDERYGEAEKLLRSLITKLPEQPDALKELNRAIMRGRVYGQGRWDLLKELAAQGTVILKAHDDEETYLEMAKTLLAIPAMTDAISFLENWIHKKGPAIERLGMLAWARCASGQFSPALAAWDELFSLAQTLPGDPVKGKLPYISYTMANAFSEAGEITHAQVIARQSWELCGKPGPLPAQGTFIDDSDWLSLWHMAKLEMDEISSTLLMRHPQSQEFAEQAVRLAIFGWINLPEDVITGWIDWARGCITGAHFSLLEKYRLSMLSALRTRGLWREANQLAWDIWKMLGMEQSQEAQAAKMPWDWERFNPVQAVDAQQWQAAQDLVAVEITERGVQGAVGWAAIVAGGSGSPTPPEIVHALEVNGVDQVDEYGMFGWYIIAREAAAAGDRVKAFDALRKALSYWSNPPYWITNLWEKDTYWGSLASDPEFRDSFDRRRQQIGMIYGWLHYFPSW